MHADDEREEAGSEREPVGVGVDPDALDVLGHEIRLAVLEVLAAERREAWLPKGLSFSELFDRVPVDDSGKFNYHLGKLTGTYVHEWDGEYVLTNAGFEVVGAIRAGTLGGDAPTRHGTIDRTCPRCDAHLVATYEHGYLRVGCPDHGDLLASTLPPTAVRDRDLERVYELATERARDTVHRVRAGGCPHCWGTTTLEAPATTSEAYLEAHDYGDEREVEVDQVLAEAHCEDCDLRFWLPVSILVADHPAVVSYLHTHGVDHDGDYLDLPHVTGSNGTVVDDDPIRIEVEVTPPTRDATETDERDAASVLVLTLDAQTTVLDYRRETRPGDDAADVNEDVDGDVDVDGDGDVDGDVELDDDEN